MEFKPNEINQKDFYYVYFIINHISTTSPKISVSGEGGLIGELRSGKEKIYSEEGQKEQFLYYICYFKIYPLKIKEKGKNEVELKIVLENEGEKFDHRITLRDFDKDSFIYGVEFKEKGILKKIKPPKSIKFTILQQFEIYKDYLENEIKIKEKPEKRNEDFLKYKEIFEYK